MVEHFDIPERKHHLLQAIVKDFIRNKNCHLSKNKHQNGCGRDFHMMNDANLSTTMDALRFVKDNVDEVSTSHA
ncbi:hypothetical protein P8452_32031 [Trifolium repens]|nr:hypothetical protein P8452_32031 [Trifolium repens]